MERRLRASDRFEDDETIVKDKSKPSGRGRPPKAGKITMTASGRPIVTPPKRVRRTIYDDYHRAVGENIYRMRMKKGLSQSMLATLSGIGLNAVSVLENGKTDARLDTLRKIARVLECSVVDLIPDKTFIDNIRTKALIDN
jgi:DNA-binding Xre family transcriptional regulator